MPLHYTSYKNTEPLQIKISGQNDHLNEAAGLVSVGFSARDGLINCVAVKLTSTRDGNSAFYVRSRNIMHRIQQKLSKNERKYLIEMFDAGYTTPYGEGALIMELGEESFAERLYGRRRTVQYKSGSDLLGAISELAQPLVEFHKIAVHMDVNPRNYLYVLDNGRTVLKLIDFEGAQYISSSNPNESVVVGVHAFTPEYTGPEYYDPLYGQISTKFDIWSVGMIAFELFVDRLRAERGERPMNDTERRTTLCNIGNLYLGFKRNRFGDFPGAVKEVLISYAEDRNWVWQNSDAINTVLQLWLKFPKTALLVTNLLHFQQEKRLTAQGILDYINVLLKKVLKVQQREIYEMEASVAMEFEECEAE
uniref:Protein kinase domain-containing protein n=1 Tax=Globodera rostochiensis TaxID=31243 RepID=A0A914HQ72_GLORO